MTPKRGKIEEADLLGVLSETRHPLSVRELAGKLNAHGHERHELKKLVKRLLHSGRVAEVHGGRYMLADRKAPPEQRGRERPREQPRAASGTITGRLVAHRDGYGFVIPDKPIPGMQGDVFIPPNAIGDAMH
ncbi:MAG: hypothetical protein ACRD5I_16995, partial [Candidatus Acidiferrales bacterium]